MEEVGGLRAPRGTSDWRHLRRAKPTPTEAIDPFRYLCYLSSSLQAILVLGRSHLTSEKRNILFRTDSDSETMSETEKERDRKRERKNTRARERERERERERHTELEYSTLDVARPEAH